MALNKFEKLALDIIDLCTEHGIFYDISIFVNGNCLSDRADLHKIQKKTKKNHIYYLETGRTPNLEYQNPDGLTMTFEGPLYAVLNYGECPEFEKKFRALFAKYNLYFEQGFAWSLAAWPV